MSDPSHASAPQHRTEQDTRILIRRIIVELAPNRNAEAALIANLVQDLEYHSLALLELAFALEDEFTLQPIDEPTARKIITVKDVEEHVIFELRSTGRLSAASS